MEQTQHLVANEDQIYEMLASTAYLMVNKQLLRALGPEPTVMLSNLLDKYKFMKENNMLREGNIFYLEHEEQMRDTSLTEHKIRACKSLLKQQKIISTKRIGNKEYYKLNAVNILSLIQSNLTYENSTSEILTSEILTSDLGNSDPNTIKNKERKEKIPKKEKIFWEKMIEKLPEEWQSNVDLIKAINDWLIVRKEKRQFPTEHALELAAGNLSDYSLEVAIESLRQSARNSWIGLFPERVGQINHTLKRTAKLHSSQREEAITPLQLFESKFKPIYAKRFFAYYERALNLLTNINNGQADQLAHHLVDLRDFILNNQTEVAANNPEIPSPGKLISDYIDWLGGQTWMNDINPGTFQPAATVFKKFLNQYSAELTWNVFTGKRQFS